MRRINVVFLDAAGTLFHVKGSVAEVYLAYADRFGVRQTPALLEAVSTAFRRAFHDAPPPLFAASDPVELKQCERLWWFDIVHNVFYRVGMFDGFDEYFDTVFQAFDGPQHWTVYPETLGVLKELKGRGVELGVISNFDTRLFNIMRGLGLADLFETVTISSLAQAAKPAGRIFRLALEKHAADADEAVHVGDSLRDDAEGAAGAGLSGVWLNRGSGDSAAQVPTIRNLEELLPLLSTL